MIYTRDVSASARFYADLLGFKMLEEFRSGGVIVYSRLKSPKGATTIALHMIEPGARIADRRHPAVFRNQTARSIRPSSRGCRRPIFTAASGHAVGLETCVPQRP
jgi:catechol 2,3-dioxygenase-like lactoylglutathione lyase family enzyme